MSQFIEEYCRVGCGILRSCRRFGGTFCIHLTGNRVRIVDNNTLQLNWRQCFVWNVGKLLPDRTSSRPRGHRSL